MACDGDGVGCDLRRVNGMPSRDTEDTGSEGRDERDLGGDAGHCHCKGGRAAELGTQHHGSYSHNALCSSCEGPRDNKNSVPCWLSALSEERKQHAWVIQSDCKGSHGRCQASEFQQCLSWL
jgi:hypothetical protein